MTRQWIAGKLLIYLSCKLMHRRGPQACEYAWKTSSRRKGRLTFVHMHTHMHTRVSPGLLIAILTLGTTRIYSKPWHKRPDGPFCTRRILLTLARVSNVLSGEKSTLLLGKHYANTPERPGNEDNDRDNNSHSVYATSASGRNTTAFARK